MRAALFCRAAIARRGVSGTRVPSQKTAAGWVPSSSSDSTAVVGRSTGFCTYDLRSCGVLRPYAGMDRRCNVTA